VCYEWGDEGFGGEAAGERRGDDDDEDEDEDGRSRRRRSRKKRKVGTWIGTAAVAVPWY
jgi:hypothetical protein